MHHVKTFARRVTGTQRTAAAPALNIVDEFLHKYWPDIVKALADEDYDTAERLLNIIQHAYFYAPGMNEMVIRLTDTRNDPSNITELLKAVKRKDNDKIRMWREFVEQETVPNWQANLKKYRWQKGMRAEEIQRSARDILNRAYEELGNTGGRRVSDIFFSKGPDAAQAALDKSLARKRKRAG
jgi:hypothetical protein